MGEISVRRLTEVEEIRACEGLQAAAWLMADHIDVVPLHQMLTAGKYGGVVVGAFDGAELIGFAYGFVGLYQGRTMLCSHMNAVLAPYRGRGVGYALKLEQRRCALENGLDLMHWTFDPMALVNGNLNVRRLGATCGTYHRALYGEMRDGVNAGMPSDRLVAEWELDSPRVLAALQQGSAPAPLPGDCHSLTPGAPLPEDGRPLALEVPRDFAVLRATRPEAALLAKLAVRHACEAAFVAGYRMTGAWPDGYVFTR